MNTKQTVLRYTSAIIIATLASASVSKAAINATLKTASVKKLNDLIREANKKGGGVIRINIPAKEGNVFKFDSKAVPFTAKKSKLTIKAKRRVVFNGKNKTHILEVRGNGSSLIVNNINFQDCTITAANGSPPGGAGITTPFINTNCFIKAMACQFRNCRSLKTFAGGGGGGIRCRIGNRVEVRDSVFFRCVGPTGGGVAVTQSNTKITGSEFTKCKSVGALDGGNVGPKMFNSNGGAVRIDSPSKKGTKPVVVRNCTFTENVRSKSVTRGGVALNIFTDFPAAPKSFYAKINDNKFIKNVGKGSDKGPTVRLFADGKRKGIQAQFKGNTFTKNNTEKNISNANVVLVNK